MTRLRNSLIVLAAIWPLLAGAIAVVIRDNDHVIATYNVELVRINGTTVTGMPDRIFTSGF